MSLKGFKQRLANETVQDISTYVQQHHPKLLTFVNSDDRCGRQQSGWILQHDPCIPILKCYLSHDLTSLIGTPIPWKTVQNCHFNFSHPSRLSQEDLSEERMINVCNGLFYFNLLQTFLRNHEIEEIPKSFIDHYKFINDSFYLPVIGRIIRGNFPSRSMHLRHNSKVKMNNKWINLMILFLEHYEIPDFSYSLKMICQKRATYIYLTELFDDNVIDDSDDEWDGDYVIKNPDECYYHEELITEENIVQFCFDKLQNDCMTEITINLTHHLANYFEYMRLDQQMDFWNMILEIDGKRNSHLLSVVFNSCLSDVFHKFAFEHYDKLKTEQGVYEYIVNGRIDSDETGMVYFCQNALQRFPSMRSNILIYLTIYVNDFDICYKIFPEITNQELIYVLREKFM